jgi:archaellum component FlaC
MSVESDDLETVTVSTDEVTVEKSVTLDEFPVPTVVFDVRSEASEPVEIRVTDDVPESVDMGAVGFHPEYDGEAWTAFRDRRVQYETTLDPNESIRTVYGVRADEAGDPEAFLDDPSLELPGDEDPAESEDSPALVHETTSVRDVLSDDTEEGVPTIGEAEADGAEETDDDGADETDDEPSDGVADVAASLAAAIREDEVAEEDLATLRDALGADPDPAVPTSVEVRIDRLQGQVEDLTAYTDALETFLDEEGTGSEAVAGFRADLDDLTEEVEDLDGSVASLDERMVDVEGGLDAMAEDLAALDEEVSAVAEDLDATRESVADLDDDVDERLADLADRVEDVGDDAAEMREEIERLDEFRERLNAAFGPGGDGA